MALNYEDAPDAPDALERYVFSFQLLRSDTDKRDRDLVYVVPTDAEYAGICPLLRRIWWRGSTYYSFSRWSRGFCR